MKLTKILSALFCYIYLSLCCMTNCYYASAGSDAEKDTTINSRYSHMDKREKYSLFFVSCAMACYFGSCIYTVYQSIQRPKDATYNDDSWQQQGWEEQIPCYDQYNEIAQGEPRWQRWKESFQKLENLEKSRYSESLQLLYDKINDLNSKCGSFSFTNKNEIMNFMQKCQSYKKECNNDALQLLDSIRIILGQIKRKL